MKGCTNQARSQPESLGGGEVCKFYCTHLKQMSILFLLVNLLGYYLRRLGQYLYVEELAPWIRGGRGML